jgi:hypothetical protein
VIVSQHWLARQSACEWQHALHEPLWQHSDEGQSESEQHPVVVHEPPQHFWPLEHWAVEVQAQFEPHVWVATSQHWFARHSALEQQLPGTHWSTEPTPSGFDEPSPTPVDSPSGNRVPSADTAASARPAVPSPDAQPRIVRERATSASVHARDIAPEATRVKARYATASPR